MNSQLRKRVTDETAVTSLDEIQVDESLDYIERPIAVLDRKTKVLHNKEVKLVKGFGLGLDELGDSNLSSMNHFGHEIKGILDQLEGPTRRVGTGKENPNFLDYRGEESRLTVIIGCSKPIMSQNWEADKMLDVYIHDYLLKRKMHTSAKAFMTEGKVATDPVDTTTESKEHQQQLHVMQQRNVHLQRRDPNHPPLGGSVNAMNMNGDGMMGKPSASSSTLGVKLQEEPMKHSYSMVSETSPALLDSNKMTLMKSATNQQGLLVPDNSPNVSSTLQQIQGRPQLNTEIKQEVNLGNTQKSLPTDPSSIYGQAIFQSNSGLASVGLNQGVPGLPLKGWPLTGKSDSWYQHGFQGIDSLRPNMGLQVQNPNMQNQNQFYLASQQQQALGASPNYGAVGLPRGSQSMKDGQPTRNDGSVGSPGQMNSPKMPQMQQSTSQQHDQLQQQSNRKRKQQHSSSAGPANSSGTGNTPSSPASTHTPGPGTADGMTTIATSLHHLPKTIIMYPSSDQGTAALASSTNQLDDIEHFGDVSLDDNVESFLQHEGGGDGRQVYGFSFGEVGCIRTRKKVLCCHFSSDGKLLASAGHDKKAVLWSMDTLYTYKRRQTHSLQSLELWNMAKNKSLTVPAHDNIIAALAQSPVTGWLLLQAMTILLMMTMRWIWDMYW
uniref:LisH domain-containing protein n=1 Tax=Lactuca sativa TaxID=4236 RepID=A0A9R1UHV3_LACSA|nr:hypothetical protein LSAT_V11C900460290 [Lactuca sativa]